MLRSVRPMRRERARRQHVRGVGAIAPLSGGDNRSGAALSPRSPAGFVGTVTTPVGPERPSAESFDEPSPRQLAQFARQSRRFVDR